MKELNKSTVIKAERPVRILQFGEGNFLRAFVDWMVDISNEAGVTDMGIAIVKPRFSENMRIIEQLDEQDNMFHVSLNGVVDKELKRNIRLVKSVMDSFSPYLDYAKYLHYITSPELKIIISNTTEAGIRYEQGDDIAAQPPVSFPAKMTALLYQRFQHFDGDPQMGLSVVCCELIEDNSTTLKGYILRHAKENNLGDDFIEWVESACCFCDSLVDRIVPGLPSDRIDEIEYDDKLIVAGELYHLWAIGGDGYERIQRELPLDKAGLNVHFMPSIKEFRDKKVRILNGSHTGMVPIALQMGCETVMDAFNTPLVERFVGEMVAREVIPMIDEDQDELKSFAGSILERFYNPFIKHQLSSIALNSLSKWEARNYPTVKDMWFKRGEVAKFEAFTFAALLTLYSGKSGFEPNDNSEHVAFIQSNWDSGNLRATVEKIVGNRDIWIEDLSVIDGFADFVADSIWYIESWGMSDALKCFGI